MTFAPIYGGQRTVRYLPIRPSLARHEGRAVFSNWPVDNWERGIVFNVTTDPEEPQELEHDLDVTMAAGESD